MEDFINKYIASQTKAVSGLPVEKIADIIGQFRQALVDDKQIFVFGNGGSAANASHFVTDLGKGSSDATYRRFRCVALNDNVSWMTAIANDYSYEDVFVRQLMNLANAGDLVFAMSVSGNSPNVVKAVEWASKNGMKTIALVGGKSGKVASIAASVLVVDDVHYGRVEDAHMNICHMIAYAFMEVRSLQGAPKRS